MGLRLTSAVPACCASPFRRKSSITRIRPVPFAMWVTAPDTTGRIEVLRVTGVEPAGGSVAANSGGMVSFKAHVALVNPFVTAPVAAPVNSRFEMRCRLVINGNVGEVKPRLNPSLPASISNCPQVTLANGMVVQTIPKMHWGLDLLSPVGTPVYASMSGAVVAGSNDNQPGSRRLASDADA